MNLYRKFNSEYVATALGTETDYAKLESLLQDDWVLFSFLGYCQQAILFGKLMGMVKALLMYGKIPSSEYGGLAGLLLPPEIIKEKEKLIRGQMSDEDFVHYRKELVQNILDDRRLLHASLGLVAESCEFLEQVISAPDKVVVPEEWTKNMVDELGDLFWFMGLAVDELSTQNEEKIDDCIHRVLDGNLEKLKKRYRGKAFDAQAAIEQEDKSL